MSEPAQTLPKPVVAPATAATAAGIFIKTDGRKLTAGDHIRIGFGLSGGITENGKDLNSRFRLAFCRHHGFDCPNDLYYWIQDKFNSPQFDGMLVYWERETA
jgi:hypothetical protein